MLAHRCTVEAKRLLARSRKIFVQHAGSAVGHNVPRPGNRIGGHRHTAGHCLRQAQPIR